MKCAAEIISGIPTNWQKNIFFKPIEVNAAL
jgi:hypothetical protein